MLLVGALILLIHESPLVQTISKDIKDEIFYTLSSPNLLRSISGKF